MVMSPAGLRIKNVLVRASSNLPDQTRKIRSWVLWDPDPRMTVLAKASSDLPKTGGQQVSAAIYPTD
jgi:hypothetical protein